MCGICGGKLKLTSESRATEAKDQRVIEAVRHALEIEMGGLAFYGKGAASLKAEGGTGAETIIKLFERLAEMEEEHLHILARRYHLDASELEKAAKKTALTPAQVAVWGGVETPVKEPADLLRLAVRLEKRAAAFFEEQAMTFAVGSLEAKLYRELCAEEKEHQGILETELVRFLGGKPGLMS
jgi:rubrerythrin